MGHRPIKHEDAKARTGTAWRHVPKPGKVAGSVGLMDRRAETRRPCKQGCPESRVSHPVQFRIRFVPSCLRGSIDSSQRTAGNGPRGVTPKVSRRRGRAMRGERSRALSSNGAFPQNPRAAGSRRQRGFNLARGGALMCGGRPLFDLHAPALDPTLRAGAVSESIDKIFSDARRGTKGHSPPAVPSPRVSESAGPNVSARCWPPGARLNPSAFPRCVHHHAARRIGAPTKAIRSFRGGAAAGAPPLVCRLRNHR